MHTSTWRRNWRFGIEAANGISWDSSSWHTQHHRHRHKVRYREQRIVVPGLFKSAPALLSLSISSGRGVVQYSIQNSRWRRLLGYGEIGERKEKREAASNSLTVDGRVRALLAVISTSISGIVARELSVPPLTTSIVVSVARKDF